MFETFSRSLEITKATFDVIRKDKEIFAFPIMGFLISLIFMAIVVMPLYFFGMIFAPVIIIAVIIYYLGFAFISAFIDVCITYTAKTRFEGKDATFKDSIMFAISIIHLIFFWAIVKATVGIIFSIVDNMIQKTEGIVRFILMSIRKLVGFAWEIITLFVVPSIVFNKTGPIDSIKNSYNTLKKTWGESIILYAGVFVIESALNFAGITFFAILLVLSIYAGSLFGAITTIIIAILYFTIVRMVLGIASTVFNAALYMYASTGKVPEGFKKDMLDDAVKKSQQRTE